VTLYVGAAVLMLAIVGAWADRSRRALFFVGLGLFAFIFALGFHGSLYNVVGRLPIFRAARFPSRFAYVTALCASMLAGMGVQALQRASERAQVRRGAALAVLGTVGLTVVSLLVVAFTQGSFFTMSRAALEQALPFLPRYELEEVWRHLHVTFPADVARLGGVVLAGCGLLLVAARRMASGAVVAGGWAVLTFVELASAGAEFTPVTDPSIYTSTPPLAQALHELPPGRVLRYRYYDPTYGRTQPGEFPFTEGWAVQPALYAHSLDRLPDDANLIWRVPAAGGFSPLQTLALKALLGRPNEESTVIEFDLTRPLDLLGVRYILTPRAKVPGDYEFVRKVGDISIFRNPHAMPRAFIVHRAEPAPPGQQAVALLNSPDFDYASRLLVQDAPAPLLSEGEGAADADESARVSADSGDAVSVRVRLERPGYLVLADQFYPGWQVEVDGRLTPLLRADYLLRGVQLGTGEHDVRFEFRPASFRLGKLISLCALALLVGAAVLCVLLWPIGRPLPEAPWAPACTRHWARLVLVAGILFIAISPLLRPPLWLHAGREMTPRYYAAEMALLRANYAAIDGRWDDAFATLRDAVRWWPQDGELRSDMARFADADARALLMADRPADARDVAVEALSLAPAEVRSKAPALIPLAGAAPPEGG
jgi:hypothetical protein